MKALAIKLHNQIIGYLISINQGQNRFYFTNDYLLDDERRTFTLTTHKKFVHHQKLLSNAWIRWQKLHPVFSNLLPEGSLREHLSSKLKIHVDNEFLLLQHLGRDLPGALQALPTPIEQLPPYILDKIILSGDKRSDFEQTTTDQATHRPLFSAFSLAGVQTKFSMRQIITANQERFTLPLQDLTGDLLGDWIVKTPSQTFAFVPENEYSMMYLAALAGVDIPEMKLIATSSLLGIDSENTLPTNSLSYAIKRFDRNITDEVVERIHTEDFAQILGKYPHEKYHGGNYTQIAKILYQFSSNPLEDINRLTRRLVVNMLIGNGDAHLKNWSVIYPDGINPILSPAYDLVSTKVYFKNETSFSLNLGRKKNWYKTNLQDFEYWAKKADIPWRAVKRQIIDVLHIARSQWRQELSHLPMAEEQKQHLQSHWSMLDDDFKLFKRWR